MDAQEEDEDEAEAEQERKEHPEEDEEEEEEWEHEERRRKSSGPTARHRVLVTTNAFFLFLTNRIPCWLFFHNSRIPDNPQNKKTMKKNI